MCLFLPIFSWAFRSRYGIGSGNSHALSLFCSDRDFDLVSHMGQGGVSWKNQFRIHNFLLGAQGGVLLTVDDTHGVFRIP